MKSNILSALCFAVSISVVCAVTEDLNFLEILSHGGSDDFIENLSRFGVQSATVDLNLKPASSEETTTVTSTIAVTTVTPSIYFSTVTTYQDTAQDVTETSISSLLLAPVSPGSDPGTFSSQPTDAALHISEHGSTTELDLSTPTSFFTTGDPTIQTSFANVSRLNPTYL
jgi:hypothetical protein